MELLLKTRESLSTFAGVATVANVCVWGFFTLSHVAETTFPEAVKCETPLVVAKRKQERIGLAELRVNVVAIIVMFAFFFLCHISTIHPDH